MSKPNKIQYNGSSKIIAALVNVGNWLLDNGAYTLPIASASRLGGIKVGQNLTITEEGVLNAQAGGGSDVSVTPIVTTGTKIAKITITEGTSDTDYNLFAPTPSTVNDATITIKKNNTTVDSFTLNQSSNKDINISVPTVTDAYDGTSSDGMSGKAVKSAIDALDVTTSGAAASKTVTALSQTDGKISATFSDISITKSQVSDFPTNVSSFTNDSGYVTTDEKVTAESVDPSSGSYVGLCVPLVYKEDNQKPKIPSGHVMNVKKGTTSEAGYVSVSLGNSTASGTAGNKFGRIRLYSQKTKYVDLVTTANMTTADRTITLPDADGTIALTSDITTAIQALDGVITGSAGAGKTLTAFSQTDGKVTATFSDISITKSQISDFPTNVSSFTNDSGYITNSALSSYLPLAGGEMTGTINTYAPVQDSMAAIQPKTAYYGSVGASVKPYRFGYFQGAVLGGSGGTGGAGAKLGTLLMYTGSGAKCAVITPDSNQSGNEVDLTLPSASGTLLTQENILIQSGTYEFAATSGTWQYKTITFATAYKSVPLISVQPYQTGTAPNNNIMIQQQSATGFTMGRYSASKQNYIWFAIGIKA